MDATELVTARLEDLGIPEDASVDEGPGASPKTGRLFAVGSAETKPVPLAMLFVAMLAMHVSLTLRLQQTERGRDRIARKPSQVEIQIARPPPPVVPPPPPTVSQAPPSKVAASPRPQPHIIPPEPVRAPAVSDTQEVSLAAPPAEQGDVPAGSGDVAMPVAAAPPPPPPLVPPPPAPIVEAREGANYLKNPRPPYPRIARREGWEGSVLLRVRVLPTGKPAAISVQRSSGHDALDDVAREAVKGWTFAPATQAGTPIAGWVNVPIEFRLQ